MSRSEANIKVDHKENSVIKYANSSSVSAGEAIYVDGIGAIVAAAAGDASESISYYFKGKVRVPITSGDTISQGNKVYWDASANTATTSNDSSLTAGDFFLGTAMADGSAAGGYVDVDLNADWTQADNGYKTITGETDTYELEDNGLVLDATSNTVTITLPDAATAAKANRTAKFICKDASNTVTIARAGSDTVMGAASITLDVREGVELVPVGTDWIAVSNSYNVATAGIADSSITTAKLGADAVTGAKIADDAVDSEHIADDAILAAHIDDNAILSAAISAGQITTAKIAADAVDGTKIADDAISIEHLDDGILPGYICVGYGEVASNAGTSGTFAVSGALTTDEVLPSIVGTGWDTHTAGGPSPSKIYVSGAGVVTYEIGGTAYAGTAGGIGGAVIRAAA